MLLAKLTKPDRVVYSMALTQNQQIHLQMVREESLCVNEKTYPNVTCTAAAP